MKVEYLIKSVEFVSYLTLNAIAICFIYKSGVIENYFKGITDTYLSEIEPTEHVHPEVKICMYKSSKLPVQFQVTYGWRKAEEDFEMAHFYKIPLKTYMLSFGRCYLIEPPILQNLRDDFWHGFRIKFNNSFDEMPNLNVELTTSDNSNIYGRYYDGEPFSITISPGIEIESTIKEKWTKYLIDGNCRDQPILKYLHNHLLANKSQCGQICQPKNVTMGKQNDTFNRDIPNCKQSQVQDEICSMNLFKKIMKTLPKICIKKEFIGSYKGKMIVNDHWCSQVWKWKIIQGNLFTFEKNLFSYRNLILVNMPMNFGTFTQHQERLNFIQNIIFMILFPC